MEDIVREIQKRFKKILRVNNISEEIKSAFLYGGNIDSIKKNQPLKTNEIDLLIVVNRKLAPGEPPIPKEKLESITFDLKYNNKNFILVYNGIVPESYNGKEYLLDIIGDGLPNIEEKDPSAIIVAYKPRLLIYGKEVYSSLSKVKFTKEMRDVMINVMTNYIRREFYNRKDIYAVTALAKNCIFIASLFSNYTIKANDKDLIVQKISVQLPELKPVLIEFQKAYHDPDIANKSLLNNYFDKMCKQLKDLENLEL